MDKRGDGHLSKTEIAMDGAPEIKEAIDDESTEKVHAVVIVI